MCLATRRRRGARKLRYPLISKKAFPRVLSRRVRKRDNATSTRPVDPDRWTGNCPLSFCDAVSLSYVSEKFDLPPSLPSDLLSSRHTPPLLPPRPLSFLVCVCNRLAEAAEADFAPTMFVLPFGGFPNFYPLLTMKNVSRYVFQDLPSPNEGPFQRD